MNTNESLLDAARNGRTETVKALVAEGANVNAKDEDGDTALMYVCAYGVTDVARALVDAGADVNAKNKNGQTALMRAARSARRFGHAVVAMLVNAGANVDVQDKDGHTALTLAAQDAAADTVKLLVNAGASDAGAALVAAAAEGDAAKVRELLEGGASANAQKAGGFSALMGAAFFGHTDAALQLMHSGQMSMRVMPQGTQH